MNCVSLLSYGELDLSTTLLLSKCLQIIAIICKIYASVFQHHCSCVKETWSFLAFYLTVFELGNPGLE